MNKSRLILITLIALILCLFSACEDKKNDTTDPLLTEDREKFIGNWAGSYECGSPTADTLQIWLGTGDWDFVIVIHAQTWNPDTVSGELVETNKIDVPEQTMGYFPGTAEITYSNGKLSYSQSGLGITCNGSNYTKF